MNKTTLIILLSFFFRTIYAQIPPGYYDDAEGFVGLSLKIKLHNIIKNHNVQPYNTLFQHFESTDMKPNGKVWDIYSDVPGGQPPYVYTFVVDQCGNYSQEGDCFNREHAWPSSWFGGSTSIPIYSDLHAIFPTDGFVNTRRANYPYGTVASPTWTSLNGSKVGPSSFPSYSGIVFEPINEYKGDLARAFFYITVRYYNEGNNWPGSEQTIGSELNVWSYQLLYNWHKNDTVSQKEIDRNNAIYLIQNNRNPFIDNPAWVDSILHPLGIINVKNETDYVNIFPNPLTSNYLSVSYTSEISEINVYNPLGSKLMHLKMTPSKSHNIDLSNLDKGIYIIQVKSKEKSLFKKIIKY